MSHQGFATTPSVGSPAGAPNGFVKSGAAGELTPDGAGHDCIWRYARAAANRCSSGSPSGRVKSSRTEHPGKRSAPTAVVFCGVKPSP